MPIVQPLLLPFSFVIMSIAEVTIALSANDRYSVGLVTHCQSVTAPFVRSSLFFVHSSLCPYKASIAYTYHYSYRAVRYSHLHVAAVPLSLPFHLYPKRRAARKSDSI